MQLRCASCGGIGGVPCQKCRAAGYVIGPFDEPDFEGSRHLHVPRTMPCYPRLPAGSRTVRCEDCPSCKGRSSVGCTTCDGSGYIERQYSKICPTCDGERSHPCPACHGTGVQGARPEPASLPSTLPIWVIRTSHFEWRAACPVEPKWTWNLGTSKEDAVATALETARQLFRNGHGASVLRAAARPEPRPTPTGEGQGFTVVSAELLYVPVD